MPETLPTDIQQELAAARARIAELEAQLAAAGAPVQELTDEALRSSLGLGTDDYQFLVNHTNLVIWVMDLASGRFTYVSPGVERLRGYTPAEVLAQSMEQALSAGSIAKLQHELPGRLQRYLAGEPDSTSYVDELQQPCKDGSTVWTEASTTFVRTPDGQLKVLGISRDISQRKVIEARLHNSEARLQAVIAQSVSGIMVIDSTGTVIEWNQALEQITGIPAGEALGQKNWDVQDRLRVDEFVPRLTPEMYQRMYQQGLASDHSPFFGKTMEMEIRKPSGEKAVIAQSIFPIQTGEGLLIGSLIRDISEQARARETQRRYQLLATHSRDIILFIREEDGRILEANQAAAAAYGYTIPELLELSIFDLRQESADTVKGQMGQAAHSTLLFTARHRRKDGSSFPVEVSSEGAELNGVHILVSVIRDISEREEASRLVAESQEKFKRAFHSSPALMAFSDLETHCYVDVNETFLRIMGFTREEVVGHSTGELNIFADPLKVQREALPRLAQSGRMENFEVDVVTKSGEILHGIFFGELIEMQGKRLLFTVMNDISERKRAELALRESEQRYRVIFDGATEGIIAVSLDGQRFLYANPAMSGLFGYQPDEFLQMNVTHMHPADWLPRVYQFFSEIIKGRNKHAAELACLRKDGSRFYADIAASLIEINGEPAMIGFFTDVSERRRNLALARARLWLNGLPTSTSLDDLIQQTLDQAELITDSRIGFFHFVEEDQRTLSLQNWSTNTVRNMCKAGGKGQHYPVEQAGVWADALRSGRPVIVNDYATYPSRKGLPEGHAQMTRFISVPVVRDGKVTAMIGVGEKEVDYDQRDVDVVALLASEAWDIILRKRVENALRQREELYRTLIESQEALILLADAGGTLQYANPLAAAFAGKTPDAMRGATLREVFPRDFGATLQAVITEVVHSTVGRVIETHTQLGGKLYWYRTSVQPIRDESGSVSLALISAVDITIQKSTELILESRVLERTHEIETVRQRLELAASVAEIGIWDWDIQTNDMLWDERMFLIYNLPHTNNRVSMDAWELLLHPDDLQEQQEFMQAVLRQEQEYRTEFRILWPDGTQRTIESQGIVMYDANGQPVRMIGIDHDITARKQAETVLRNSEEMLRRANRELERAMRTKDEFLASMSHELRTPLTGILGLSEALQQQVYGEVNPNQNKALSNIHASGTHLLNLINDILDVSKIESGKFEMQFEMTSLSDICQASLQMVKGMAQKKRLKVGLSISPALIHLWCDPRRMKQILVNLLSNAVKFTPAEGSLGLEVAGDEDAHSLRLCVWDTGIGIKEQDLQRIFQPFVQVDSSLAREQTGSGLGLVLVQRLVELHEGTLHVSSVPGQGSRFEFSLPWKDGGQSKEESAQPRMARIQRAMTVEDNDLDAGHLTRLLNKLGIENMVFNQGRFILQHAVELNPQVILLDIGLPDLSGWSVLEELKSDPATRQIPVIITSVEDKRAEASRLNAAAYLVKPFSYDELQQALAMAVPAQAPAPAQTPAAQAQPDAPAPLVILVDDNEVNSMIVIDFLQANHFRAQWMGSGFEFLEQAAQLQPDLVLMDIQMPGIDGLEVIRRVRAHPDKRLAACRIIANTALAMPGDRERCLQAGADDYLSKPFRLKDLLDLIHKHLALPS